MEFIVTSSPSPAIAGAPSRREPMIESFFHKAFITREDAGMICKKASYYRFRNIESAEIQFSDRINVIYGDNAVGKTSAIEGIYLCAQGRSHRTSHEKDYIKFGEDYGAISVLYEDTNRQNDLSMLWSQKGKRQCRMRPSYGQGQSLW